MLSAIRLGRRALRCLKDRRGVGAVEFAFIAPVVIMLILGTTELGQYILKNQSLGMAAGRIGDLVTREEALSRDQVLEYVGSVEQITGSNDFDPRGYVIVSAVTGVNANLRKVSWQVGGGGDLEATSSIGREGGPANLPDNVVIGVGDTLIAVEVFYFYDGLFSGMYENLFGDGITPVGVLRKTAWFRGRKSDLDVLCRNGNPGTGNNGNCGSVDNQGNTGGHNGQPHI